MKRMHIHVHVDDLATSIQFYERIYGQRPTVLKADYAKWVLEDPRVNFAISNGAAPGSAVSHLGIEVDSPDELEGFNARLQAVPDSDDAGGATNVLPEKDARCCYAISDKYWARDPGGVVWEFFHTRGSSDDMGDHRLRADCC